MVKITKMTRHDLLDNAIHGPPVILKNKGDAFLALETTSVEGVLLSLLSIPTCHKSVLKNREELLLSYATLLLAALLLVQGLHSLAVAEHDHHHLLRMLRPGVHLRCVDHLLQPRRGQ